MTGLPWLRLYTEYATDPKIQILAFDDQRHFVMLLCLKGNGTLDCDAPNEAYRERLIAKALGLDASTASEAKRRLLEGGLITADWMPVAWENRQMASDHDGAERQKRYRENKKRDSDGDVTSPLRDSDAIDKKRLDKTRQDKTKSMAGRNPPDWFEEFKQVYPKRAGDQQWRKAMGCGRARITEGHQPVEFIAGAARYAVFLKATGKVGTEYVKQAASFLGPDKPFLLPWNPPAAAETASEEILRLNSGEKNAPGRVFEAEPGRTGLVPLFGNVRR